MTCQNGFLGLLELLHCCILLGSCCCCCSRRASTAAVLNGSSEDDELSELAQSQQVLRVSTSWSAGFPLRVGAGLGWAGTLLFFVTSFLENHPSSCTDPTQAGVTHQEDNHIKHSDCKPSSALRERFHTHLTASRGCWVF